MPPSPTTIRADVAEVPFPAPRPGKWRRRDAARDTEIRKHVLEMASFITVGRTDAAAVLANARPLLAWLAASVTRSELERRYAALAQQFDNTVVPRHLYRPDNGTRALIEGAQILLTVLTLTRSLAVWPKTARFALAAT
jgi:hypothetical protein